MASGCDGCGATGVPLAKVSLTRDFFGGVYDRLTPASDKAPAWYCPDCSNEKHMQTDFRLILAAWHDHRDGKESPLDDPGVCRRAHGRLQDIAAQLGGGDTRGLVAVDEIITLVKEMESVGCP